MNTVLSESCTWRMFLDKAGSLRARCVISANLDFLAKSISTSQTLSCSYVSALTHQVSTSLGAKGGGLPSPSLLTTTSANSRYPLDLNDFGVSIYLLGMVSES